jgi:hypothetical protein
VKFLQFALSVGSNLTLHVRLLSFGVEAYRIHTQRYLCILTLDVVMCPDTKSVNLGFVLGCVSMYILAPASVQILPQGLAFQSLPLGHRGVVLVHKVGWF